MFRGLALGFGGRLLHALGIPSAGRCGNLERLGRLLLNLEGLGRELGFGERCRIEPLGDVVTLVRGIGITLRCGEAEPFIGFGEVLFDADAARVKNAEVELAVGDAVFGGLAEPVGGDLVVRFAAAIAPTPPSTPSSEPPTPPLPAAAAEARPHPAAMHRPDPQLAIAVPRAPT